MPRLDSNDIVNLAYGRYDATQGFDATVRARAAQAGLDATVHDRALPLRFKSVDAQLIAWDGDPEPSRWYEARIENTMRAVLDSVGGRARMKNISTEDVSVPFGSTWITLKPGQEIHWSGNPTGATLRSLGMSFFLGQLGLGVA